MKERKKQPEYISLVIRDGDTVCYRNHESFETWNRKDTRDGWTLVGVTKLDDHETAAVVEDFSDNGGICYVDQNGKVIDFFERHVESTKNDEENAYAGYLKQVVVSSNADLMGNRILEQKEDPNYEQIKKCLPPIRIAYCQDEGYELPHTFIGTPKTSDVIPLYYGIRYNISRIHHGYVSGDIEKAVDQHTVCEGLLGGWLPVVIMRYPYEKNKCWEFMAFAKTDVKSENIQPAWYRYVKLVDGKVEEIHYYDSYLPYPLENEPDGTAFYADLYRLRKYWEEELDGGMQLTISAEPWVPDFCMHSMARERIGRTGMHPRYGSVIRNYGAPEHDGFQDILTSSVDCYLEWGKTRLAKAYLENYFDEFVRDSGQLEYRGPEMGQYGRMLTELAQYYAYTNDLELIAHYEKKIMAITDILLNRRAKAKELSKEDPAYGMLHGRHEADVSFVHPDFLKYDFERPYFSNSTEAWRGFRDSGAMWKAMGQEQGVSSWENRGDALLKEAEALQKDILTSLERSVRMDRSGAFLPSIAGSRLFYYDYPYRSTPDSFDDNRVWCEMMHSGVVPKKYVQILMESGREYNGMKLGIFGNRNTVVAFICYGEAYGLIQHDMIREFLMFFYAHALHLHTRGSWTAFECVDIDRDRGLNTGYCPPAQMTIPTITKWMLVFEDPMSDTLWLCKATPREWLADGEQIQVQNAPTRWGTVSMSLHSEIQSGRVYGELILPEKCPNVVLRLRVPENKKIVTLRINDQDVVISKMDEESVVIPEHCRGSLRIEAELL